MEFQQDWPKDKIRALNFLPEDLEKFRSTEHFGGPQRDRQFLFVTALWAVRQWKAVDYLS